jgi:hypothetical protein
MKDKLIEITLSDWQPKRADPDWVTGLEAGKVLYLPRLAFELLPEEEVLLSAEVLDPKVRNISLNEHDELKGAQGDADTRQALKEMIGRFRGQAQTLVGSLMPKYQGALRLAPTSYRPMPVGNRKQSWRADDRRLHVDAFPSRPNYGERILRVFTNINPHGEARVWRLGEPFEVVAERMLPRAKPYVPWQARLLNKLGITKSLRSEYDHLMLQLHDLMKSDLTYQQETKRLTMPFPPGSVWICFSDQVSHGVVSGQYMLEQTLHLPAEQQYDPAMSPLAILGRLTGRQLV